MGANNPLAGTKSSLSIWLLAAILVSTGLARSAQPQEEPAAPATDPSVASQSSAARRAFNTVNSGREALMLRRRWGIDDLHVRSTASGAVVRFSYRVVDADKARVLNDKKASPFMIAKKTGARLEVPTTEKVGQLRQTATPQNGREYWMVFGNVGRSVKPGDHVDVVIGAFHANELVVESAGPMPRMQTP